MPGLGDSGELGEPRVVESGEEGGGAEIVDDAHGQKYSEGGAAATLLRAPLPASRPSADGPHLALNFRHAVAAAVWAVVFRIDAMIRYVPFVLALNFQL